jgi:murein L,D-transpeptidase YcbB/YkuD
MDNPSCPPRRAAAALLAVLLAWPMASATADPARGVSPWLTGALLRADEKAADPPELLLAVHRFYEQRGLQPAWTDGTGRLTPAGERAAALLARAGEHGLRAQRYDVSAATAGEREVRLTYALLRHARDLQGGRWPSREPLVLWRRAPARELAAEAFLQGAASDPDRALHALPPTHAGYVALRAAHARLAALAARGGFEPLPAEARGSRGPWLAAVARRLQAEGDLREAAAPRKLEGALADALRRFQRRHGLAPSGVLDAATVAAWNVPPQERLRQVELNLERWRWLPRDLGSRHLLVNIPAFDLTAVDHGRPVLSMKVVTGASATPTPVFSTRLSQVVFRPWWNVPVSIAETELRPRFLRQPGEMARRGIVGSGLRLRQRPGPRNALGLVKFSLDDTPGVYLHDTPEDALFARPSRAFSHGCVRLEKPAELARLLVRDVGWDAQAVGAAMARGPERPVALAEPWDVHIVYFTAWVDEQGALRFVPDVYGHDRLQQQVLDGSRDQQIRPQAKRVTNSSSVSPSRPARWVSMAKARFTRRTAAPARAREAMTAAAGGSRTSEGLSGPGRRTASGLNEARLSIEPSRPRMPAT